MTPTGTRRTWAPVLRIALAAALAAGCGAGRASSHATAPTGAPRPGDAATFIVPNEPPTLDPAALNNSYATHGAVGNALYGQLVRNDPVTGRVVPTLASSLTTKDGRGWTLKLRPGLRFSDGTPLDAAAVKFNWDRMKDPKTAAALNVASAAAIGSSTVVDATTLTFTLRRPSMQFAQDICATAMTFVASPAALRAGPRAYSARPVGAGPFVLESWTRQDRMVLKKNPRYFDPPRPYLNELVVRTDPDQARRLTALQAGEADLITGASAEHARNAERTGQVVAQQRISASSILLFNTVKPPFNDPRAREAVTAAVDRDAINRAAYGGHGEVPKTLLVDSSPFYQDDLAFPPPDRARAQRLFDRLAAEGRPVSLTLLCSQASDAIRSLQSIQAQLSSFKNVSVKLETLDLTGYLGRLAAGDFTASLYGIPILDPEPSLGRLLTSGLPSNFGKISDPALDAALAKGRGSADRAERTAAYRTAQRRILALHPFIAYTRSTMATFSSPAVGGVGFYGQGSPLVDTLWLDPDKK